MSSSRFSRSRVNPGISSRVWRKSGIAGPGRGLGLAGLAVFSLPVLLFQAVELAWRAYLPAFLTQSVGVTLAAAGALMLGVRIMDAFADVVLGWLSDHVKTRFGRRAPWMAAGALLVPIGALLLFFAPSGAGIVRVIGASLLLHMGYSFIVTPHGGWGLKLSDDEAERTRIMGAKVWFGVLGSIGMLALIGLLERQFGFGIRSLAATLGLVIAAAAPITVLTVLVVFREPAAVPGAAGAVMSRASLQRLLAGMTRDPALRRILLLYLLCGIADASTASTFLFLAEPVLGLKGQGAMLMLIQPVMALFTLPFWATMADRLGRRRVLTIGFAWQALTMPLALLVPAGSATLFGLFLVLRGLAWGIDYMLLRAMVADVAEKGAGSGARMSGSYYALSSVTLKLALGLGAGLGLWLIGASGFHAGGPAGAAASLAIRMAYVLPSVLSGLCGLLVLNRPSGRPSPPTGLGTSALS